jgi:tetratricopeptide (TPR) repeat protein
MLCTLKDMTTASAIAILFGVLGLFAQDDRALVESQIRKWQEVVTRNPKDYDTLSAIGAAYGKLGEHATAVTYFNKAIVINPSFVGAYAGLGSAYGFLGRPAEAVAALKKAASLDPKDPLTRLKLGTTNRLTAGYATSSHH